MLTGGGAQLKNIKDLCELITTTDTRIGIPNEHLDPESVSFADLAHPMYATGIGLVLYGLEKAEEAYDGTEEEEKTAFDNDIFKNMDVDMANEVEKAEEQQLVDRKKGSKTKEKGPKFDHVLERFLNKVFNEGIDE